MSIDELQEVGLEYMDEQAIRGFLSSQTVGILGLPAPETPYLLPISYGYDGKSTLYFTYFVGSGSRKEKLSEQTETASFLVYSAESMFNWESVALAGRIEKVPEHEWDTLDDTLGNVWRPDIFKKADLSGGIAVYAFHIDEQSGIRHTGLPPGFGREPTDD